MQQPTIPTEREKFYRGKVKEVETFQYHIHYLPLNPIIQLLTLPLFIASVKIKIYRTKSFHLLFFIASLGQIDILRQKPHF
jgi:hypothetical protein